MNGASSPYVGVRRSAELGRYAVAARPVRAGQVLFEERSFVIGPKPHSPIVCLGCSRPTPTERCPQCSWPLCQPECAAADVHRGAECELFRRKSVRFYGSCAPGDENAACMQLDCITPLRMLLARDAHPERWQREIEPMEAHQEARRQLTDTWQADQVNIVGYLHGPCGLRDRYPAELIQRACGVLEVNSFEGRTEAGFLVRCVFPCAAVMAHECVPNTMHTIHPGKTFRIQVRATVEIAAGQMLAASYTYTSSGTVTRQEHLRAGKFFTCRCARCLDPTELGTHFSSIRCRRCADQGSEDAMIVATDPLDATSAWKCCGCGFATPGDSVDRVISIIQLELDEIEALPLGVKRLQRSEAFLGKYAALLADDHYLLTAIRHSLCSMYGRVSGYRLAELSDELLQHKVYMCRRVLGVLNAVHPGLSRARALMMYELQAPLLLVARAQYRRTAAREELRRALAEAADMLLLAATVLGWEPKGSAVEAVAKLAAVRRDELLQELSSVGVEDGVEIGG